MIKILSIVLLLCMGIAGQIDAQDFWIPIDQAPLSSHTAKTVLADIKNNFVSKAFTLNETPAILSGIVKGEDGTLITAGKLYLYKKQSDGQVKFVNKVDPFTGGDFNFSIDSHEHTLYFVPDIAAFPDYAPTVLGKTVSLQPNSFFTLENDSAIVLEIVKILEIVAGTKIISGTVGNGTGSGRLDTHAIQESVAEIQVILLNDNNEVVAVTETNDSGHFEFLNLPDGTFQVIMNGTIGDLLATKTLDVDLTQNNVEIIVHDITTNAPVSVKLKPEITFQAFGTVTYGDDPIAIDATSDVAIELTFESSNTNVALIENGYINIIGAGTTEITATSQGNETYSDALKIQTLTVDKASQEISFAPFEEVSTPDDIALTATASSGLLVSFASNHPEIASIDNNVIKIHTGGVVEITATQAGNENYFSASPVKQTLIVSILGLEDKLADLNVHPNPSTGKLTLNRSNAQMRFTITDVMGRMQPLQAIDNTFNLTNHQPGVYVLIIQEANTTKIIKFIRE